MVVQSILRTPSSSRARTLRSNTPSVQFDLSSEEDDDEQQVYYLEDEDQDSDQDDEPATQEEDEDIADSIRSPHRRAQEGGPEACPICALTFGTKHALQNHVRRQHCDVTEHTWRTQHAQWLSDNRLVTCTHCARPYNQAFVNQHARTCSSRDPNATSDEQFSIRTPPASAATASSSAGSPASRQAAITGRVQTRTPQGVAAILPPPPPSLTSDLTHCG